MRAPNPEPRTPNPKRRRRSRRSAAGFTLIEASLTTVIVGTGVLAIVAAQQAYQIKNDYAVRSATGQLLANEIRELTYGLPHHDPVTGDSNLGPETGEASVTDYDDLDDYAGAVDVTGLGAGLEFSPPVNAAGFAMNDLNQWTQAVSVSAVWADHLDEVNPIWALGSTEMMRVTVRVLYDQDRDGQNRTEVSRMTWVVPVPN